LEGLAVSATVLLPGGGVLCYCGRLYGTEHEAARCDAPEHRPSGRAQLQRFLAACLAVLMIGAIIGGLWAAFTANPSDTGYRVPDSGYPFQSGAP
jgi:hypothetical protein